MKNKSTDLQECHFEREAEKPLYLPEIPRWLLLCRNDKRGFTLVELSIVLVIIGLLIGGILVAQSLIESAKVNAFVSKVQQFDIATSSFKSKFSSIPGDSNKLTPAGDNDGFIEEADLGASTGTFYGEVANYWVHLQQGGFTYNGTFSATPPATGLRTTGTSPNAVEIEANRKGGITAHISEITRVGNMYFIANHDGVDTLTDSGLYSSSGVMTGAFALAVEHKIDDELPYSGKMRAINVDGEVVSAGFQNCTDVAETDSKYDATKSEIECIVSIEMLSQVGQ